MLVFLVTKLKGTKIVYPPMDVVYIHHQQNKSISV